MGLHGLWPVGHRQSRQLVICSGARSMTGVQSASVRKPRMSLMKKTWILMKAAEFTRWYLKIPPYWLILTVPQKTRDIENLWYELNTSKRALYTDFPIYLLVTRSIPGPYFPSFPAKNVQKQVPSWGLCERLPCHNSGSFLSPTWSSSPLKSSMCDRRAVSLCWSRPLFPGGEW